MSLLNINEQKNIVKYFQQNDKEESLNEETS